MNIDVRVVLNYLLFLTYIRFLYVNAHCAKQLGAVECGYYVRWFLHNIIFLKSTSIIEVVSITILKLSSCNLLRLTLI